MIEGILIFLVLVFAYIIRMLMKQIDRMEEAHRHERQILLDRIQARDLPEFKAMAIEPKPKEPKAPTDEITQV
jgi:hypothetical protein